jgi:hypothetical protein
MIACLLLFDQTAVAVSAAIGVGSILFLILFFIIMWYDQRHDSKRWELSVRMDKEDRELREQMYKDHSELRDRISVTERELRTKISDTDRQLRDALSKLRADLTTVRTSEERERMDALWASLLAESRERVERIKRKNQPTTTEPPPSDDIDAGLKHLEQTIANFSPTDDETFQRIDASLKRCAEHLKKSAEFLKKASGEPEQS